MMFQMMLSCLFLHYSGINSLRLTIVLAFHTFYIIEFIWNQKYLLINILLLISYTFAYYKKKKWRQGTNIEVIPESLHNGLSYVDFFYNHIIGIYPNLFKGLVNLHNILILILIK